MALTQRFGEFAHSLAGVCPVPSEHVLNPFGILVLEELFEDLPFLFFPARGAESEESMRVSIATSRNQVVPCHP